ncbi:MAG: hypothetical protein KAH97_09545 [Anaerolineales bacterium]|nr:hypothetical protein [Anaerolineales bacterium]
MKRKIVLSLLVFALAIVAAVPAFAAVGGRNGPSTGVVYVTSQDLYYDTIVLGALPQHGRFQKLEMEGPTGLQTEFGPGDQGFVGGRWWVDVNGDDIMDSGDVYFLCPLLGPGRASP